MFSMQSLLRQLSLLNCAMLSRLTIKNWVDYGRIKSVKTMGGHRRIPHSEVMSVLEKFDIEDDGEVVSQSVPHCWQYAKGIKCDKKCKNCLTHIRRFDYCFLVVQRFGKDLVRCKGNCSACAYLKRSLAR